MEIKDFMLHLKSLIWCLNKDRRRYNLKLIIDSLHSSHVPESIQSTTLGQNLIYLNHELATCGGKNFLVQSLKNLPSSRTTRKTSFGEIEVGQYLRALKNIDGVPRDNCGVISYLGKNMKGLFYIPDSGLIEVEVDPEDVQVIEGTCICGEE